MTHTVHPYAHRLGIIRDWKSRWFAIDKQSFRENIVVDAAIRSFLKKRVKGMHVSDIEIERSQSEIRVVLHRQTVPRLPQLARFLARNFPYASQVALMGLEPTGHVKANLDALWVDPAHYRAELAAAVGELDDAGIRVRIYNHQLCTLAPGLWPFAVRSISDWKNEYLPVCGGCSVRATCGGFFASAALRRSELIRPVAADEVPPAGAPGRESGLEGARI